MSINNQTDAMVSIIIPTYNGKELLKKCLNSIEEKTTHKKYEIVVVDDCSFDNTAEFLEINYPEIKLIRNKKNLGFSKSCNKGIRATSPKSDYLVLLNNDIIVNEYGWLSGWIKTASSYPKALLFGCKLIYPNKKLQSVGGYIRPSRLKIFEKGYCSNGIEYYSDADNYRECQFVTAAAWLLKREAIKNVGFFDEKFSPMYWEDVDYCWRVIKGGYKIIYCPKPELIHLESVTTRKSFNSLEMINNRNRFRFQLKHYPFKWWIRPQTWLIELASATYFTLKFGPKYLNEVYLEGIKTNE